MKNNFDVLGRVAVFMQAIALLKLNLSMLEIEEFLQSLLPNEIKVYQKLVNTVADHNVNLSRVLVLGDTNGILLTELLNDHCDLQWVDFVSNSIHQDVIRKNYLSENKIESNYNFIKMEPSEYSDENYDLIICVDYLPHNITAGPLYAFVNCVSKEFIIDHTKIINVWSYSEHNNVSLLIGYNEV